MVAEGPTLFDRSHRHTHLMSSRDLQHFLDIRSAPGSTPMETVPVRSVWKCVPIPLEERTKSDEVTHQDWLVAARWVTAASVVEEQIADVPAETVAQGPVFVLWEQAELLVV